MEIGNGIKMKSRIPEHYHCEIIESINGHIKSLFVEVLNVGKGVYRLPVKADLPKKVLLEKADPEVVEAAITIR